MPHVLKPAMIQFIHELERDGRMMLEKDVVPIQAAIRAHLDEIPDLLTEKFRRLPRPDGMIEISAKWIGLDSSQEEVVRVLKESWPEDLLGAYTARFSVFPSEEAVLLMFGAAYETGRFLTGRLLITF